MNYLYKSIKEYTISDYQSFINKLSTTDQKNIIKIDNKKYKHQKIIGRVLLKSILKKQYNIDYNKLIIKYNQYGKPYSKDIYFNISHSHDYVIVATSNNSIGIDIEKIRRINLNTMKMFCNTKEEEYINNSSNKYLTFWTIYTLKEAYFKMKGQNLSNMKKVEFKILADKIICLNNPNLKILTSTEIDEYVFSIIYEE